MTDIVMMIMGAFGALNTALLASIHMKLGSFSEKHKSHEKRLNNLEDKRYVGTIKRA